MSLLKHTLPAQITPKYPNPFYLFTVSHQTIYLFYFFSLNYFCLFIISSEMWYQRCLIAHYNEHPYSFIWVFAVDKRKWNGRINTSAKTKYKVMPKKHLISKVLDQQMHTCASAQSDQGLWVFTVEKRLAWTMWRRPWNIWPTKFQISMCMCIHTVWAGVCNRKNKKKKKKKKNKKKKKKKTRKAVLSITRSLFHWTWCDVSFS